MKIYQLNLDNGYEQFAQESEAIARQLIVGGTIEIIDKPDPEVIDLEMLKANAIASVKAIAKSRQDQFTENYSAAEMVTWTRKEDEARLYLISSNKDDAPTLRVEAEAQGLSLEQICAIIIGNADQWNQLQAAIVAWRGNKIAAINAAQSVEALEAIALMMPF